MFNKKDTFWFQYLYNPESHISGIRLWDVSSDKHPLAQYYWALIAKINGISVSTVTEYESAIKGKLNLLLSIHPVKPTEQLDDKEKHICNFQRPTTAEYIDISVWKTYKEVGIKTHCVKDSAARNSVSQVDGFVMSWPHSNLMTCRWRFIEKIRGSGCQDNAILWTTSITPDLLW
jgi:hypothetical protein